MADIIEIPYWAGEFLKEQHCPYCKKPYEPSDVSAQGNRRKNGVICYFYECECSRCKNPALTLVNAKPCTSYELALLLVDFYAEKKERGEFDKPNVWELYPRRLMNSRKSKISESEITSAQNLLENSPDHDAFLKSIMTQEEINRYIKPDKGKKNEDK